ncbi:MAG: peptidase M14, partial [Planctomycetes bacterium]|nr:peptidase M14 [Planctomycetota bacterium]
MRGGAALVALLALAWITTITSAEEAAVPAKRTFDFHQPKVSFNAHFPGARLNDCIQSGPAEYRVTILPENTPINNSAWYAFQVTSDVPRTITVHLGYQGGSHRYRPKISHDGLRWTPLDPQRYSHVRKDRQATLRLDVTPKPLWVAGQELITSRELNIWADKMARLAFVDKSVIGSSPLEQPIHKLHSTGAENPGYVFLIGRQHPPEVT